MPIIQVPGSVASSTQTPTGKGLVKIWELSDFRGQTKYVLWTCWFDQAQAHLGENDEIIIEGRMSTKIGSYTTKDGETKTVVEHHLNDPIIKQHKPAPNNPQATVNIEDVPF